MTGDLSTRVLAAIERARKTAEDMQGHIVRADIPGRVVWSTPIPPVTSEITVHGTTVYDTQSVLRLCEADKRTVERHCVVHCYPPCTSCESSTCEGCGEPWPCPDLLDRADAYGVEVEVP